MTGADVLCKNWYLLGQKKIKAMPIKQDLRISLGFFSELPMSSPVFLYGSSPTGR